MCTFVMADQQIWTHFSLCQFCERLLWAERGAAAWADWADGLDELIAPCPVPVSALWTAPTPGQASGAQGVRPGAH